MLTTQEAIQRQAQTAALKVREVSHFGRFTVSGLFGGAFVGVGIVLMVSVAGPLLSAGDPLSKMVSGLVFGVALTLVVFAGAELVTSLMMTLTQGVASRTVSVGPAAGILVLAFVLNLAGAFIFSAIVVLSGVLHTNIPAAEMISQLLQIRADQTALEQFMRGVLCNVLVCLSIWMGIKIKEIGARIAVIMLAMFAFVSSGFEHVVANMTIYWIGVLQADPNASAGLFAENMLWVGLGNLIGGGLFVGLAYWFIAGSPTFTAADELASSEDLRQ